MVTALALLILFSIALLPPLLSLRAVRRYEVLVQTTVARARLTTRSPRSSFPGPQPPELTHIPGAGYVIGNLSCRFNARSPQLRCAVNPSGPCADCHWYEATP
jgi:hypothetical protein